MNKQDLIGKYFPVLDYGFVGVVDLMGDDDAIAEAARCSYGIGTKRTSNNRGLIRRLLRDQHCYAPWMEVLTSDGWKRWDECNEFENFVVPDPKTRQFKIERLRVRVFCEDEGLHTLNNKRMSYAVTKNHRMWFKGRYQDDFEIVEIQDMKKWGYFDTLNGYGLFDSNKFDYKKSKKDDKKIYDRACFTGFYLGDGSFASKDRLQFHLKKDRKKDFLRNLLKRLNIDFEEKQSYTYEDAIVFNVTTPQWFIEQLGEHLECRSKDKRLPKNKWYIENKAWVFGVLDGLVSSGGFLKQGGEQIEFSSSSMYLIELFELLNSIIGIDSHRTKCNNGVNSSKAYIGNSTTLESRKKYHGFDEYKGSVFCATTSTGLLMVRGGVDKFAFVCGNSSPFEMCEIKLHIAIPIFVMRQWIRHRTANVNEYSLRYSEPTMMFYTPDEERYQKQNKKNKQGSCNEQISHGEYLNVRDKIESLRDASEDLYEYCNDAELARELSRIDLPVSLYTYAYWKIDANNLLKFLMLRMDEHAQWEIRQYANIIAGIVKEWLPNTYEAFEDYVLGGVRFSKQEQAVLFDMVHGNNDIDCEKWVQSKCKDLGMVKSEIEAFINKIKFMGNGHKDVSLDFGLCKSPEFFAELHGIKKDD